MDGILIGKVQVAGAILSKTDHPLIPFLVMVIVLVEDIVLVGTADLVADAGVGRMITVKPGGVTVSD